MNNNLKKIGIVISSMALYSNISLPNDIYALETIKVVKNEKEFIDALRNHNVEQVIIENNIEIGNLLDNKEGKKVLEIVGDNKQIIGNKKTITGIKSDENIEIIGNKIVNLESINLNQIDINLTGYSELESVNLNNTSLSMFKGKINNLDFVNSEMYTDRVEINQLLSENSNIRINGGSLSGSRINSSYMEVDFVGDKQVYIKDTEFKGTKDYDKVINVTNMDSVVDEGELILERVKIESNGKYGILQEPFKKTKITVKDEIEFSGMTESAVVLKEDTSLNVEGNIKQSGTGYTVKAYNEGYTTHVIDNMGVLEKGVDNAGTAYYNAKGRGADAPELPNKVVDNGNNSGGDSSDSDTNPTTEEKLVGSNRYDTAVQISKRGWKSADNVVLVNGTAIPDALSATPFAKKKDAPVLLTGKDKLNEDTKNEIKRLSAKNIYVIGGESVISDKQIKELENTGVFVTRISGDDRYETSLELAKQLGDVSSMTVVNGVSGLSDAVSIAPIAAEENMPIILSSPKNGIDKFKEYMKDQNINKSYVIGGENAVSESIESTVPNAERIGGSNRNETNANIIDKFYKEEILNNVFVAKNGMNNETDIIDALAVGVLAAKEESPVVITGKTLSTGQKNVLAKKDSKEVTQVGGKGNEGVFESIISIFK